jgi:hypothetical protein
MLKRTISSVLFATINNRRWFSLTTISNRQEQQKNVNNYSNEGNNQQRQFGNFQSRPSNSKNRIQQNKRAEEEDLDVIKPQFNRYNTTRSRSKVLSNTKPIEDEENDLFAEEKDDLTMLGTDKKAFSSLSTVPAQKPSKSAISLAKKTDT